MTYKTIGDVVMEHAKQDTLGTDDGIRMLELKGHVGEGERNGAANLYLAALSIIREQRKELDALHR